MAKTPKKSTKTPSNKPASDAKNIKMSSKKPDGGGAPKQSFKKVISKAIDAKKRLVKGDKNLKHAKKIRTSVHFRRPATLKLKRAPRAPSKAVNKRPRLDDYSILKYPIASEKAMTTVEAQNTLVFICDLKANKHQIMNAIRKRYKLAVLKVRTMITPQMEKKAYVRLTPDCNALDAANRIGFI